MFLNVFLVSPSMWSTWTTWSPMAEQPCGSGQRSRQRTCPNDTLMFCEFECPLGDVQLQTDCCVGKASQIPICVSIHTLYVQHKISGLNGLLGLKLRVTVPH